MKKQLFHGSDHIIETPIYGVGKKHNDYGQGFYCTEDIALAKEWAVSEEKDGYVNEYEIETNGLHILNINDGSFTLLHWMGLLLNNRAFVVATPLEREAKRYITDRFPVPLAGVDVIIGYRADDSYFSYARDFISGVISYEQLGKAMQLGCLGEQYCLKTEKAFQHLKFIAKEHVPSAEWYSKKMLRDRNARNGYKDMEKETYHRGELYISRIIDEEMKSDDLFLR